MLCREGYEKFMKDIQKKIDDAGKRYECACNKFPRVIIC